jgi:formate hydrogenlyase subunit 3/multisubunit Na+/H+ antiporter MnhD subunit
MALANHFQRGRANQPVPAFPQSPGSILGLPFAAGCICFFLVLFSHFHQSTFVTYGFRPLLFISETYGCPFGFLADAFPDEVFRRSSR